MSLREDELLNEHTDHVIRVHVIPVAVLPTTLVDALRQQTIVGAIPASVADDTAHHRSLKQLRDDFVVAVSGCFSKDEIARFIERLDIDSVAVTRLLSSEGRSLDS